MESCNSLMKSFVTRVLSALVAVAILIGLYYFLGNNGLKLFTVFGVFVGGFELMKLLFKPEDSKLNRTAFYVFLVTIFFLSSLYPHLSGSIFCLFSVFFCLISLVTHYKFEDLETLTHFQAKGMMGFLYMGLLPSFPILILNGPHGIIWFLMLLLVVFAGDIGAYATGVNFGRRKLMPTISPKKSLEGSVGGLISSSAMGFVISYFLPHIPVLYMVLLSLLTAVAGQLGDLFESQLKRVAGVKDSGQIMPGHGGVLDRIDGVLFACPVIYLGSILLENL